MKRISIICGTFLFMTAYFRCVGQNEFFFGHYMFNQSYFNPGYIGSEDDAFVSFNHRTQWAGYDASLDPGGSPATQMVSLTAPVEGKISGLGFFFINDRAGPLTSIQIRAGLSFRKEFRFGRVSIGLMPAMNAVSVNAGYFRFNDSGDRLIPENTETQYQPNLHAGILFESLRNFFLGASLENIIEPTFSFGTTSSNSIEKNYYFVAGSEKVLSRDITLKPYLLVRSDLSSYSLEVSAIVEYRGRMWGGTSYRSSESITLLLGYSLLNQNKLRIGYSFDYVVRNTDAKEATSHEIYLRYNLPNLVLAGKKAVKTPRFSF